MKTSRMTKSIFNNLVDFLSHVPFWCTTYDYSPLLKILVRIFVFF